MDRKKPNIVFILSDEQHYRTTGFHRDQPVPTPHLDALASEGVQFENAYCCSSICSPSRAALFTGLLPHRFGTVVNDLTIPANTPNLAGQLAKAGYRLGYSGKWHVDRATLPTTHGFEGKNFPGYGFPAWMFRNPPKPGDMRKKQNFYYEYLMENGYSIPTLTDTETTYSHDRQELIHHGRQSGPEEAAIPYFVGEEAVRLTDSFCKRRSSDGQPFFLWTNFWGPHNPCYIPEPYFSMVDPDEIPEPISFSDDLSGKPQVQSLYRDYWGMQDAPWSHWQRHLARYFGYCSLIDAQVGRIIDVLKRHGEYDNTILVFSSDHGDMMGRHRMMDKGPVMYDDTYRIPMIARGPGIRKGNIGSMVYLHDWFPTLLDLADAEHTPRCDGVSMLPRLTGNGQYQERDCIFGEFDSQLTLFPQRMIRTHTHKFIFNSSDQCELYDLVNDPHEMQNRINDPGLASVKNELKNRLIEHMRDTRDSTNFFHATFNMR